MRVIFGVEQAVRPIMAMHAQNRLIRLVSDSANINVRIVIEREYALMSSVDPRSSYANIVASFLRRVADSPLVIGSDSKSVKIFVPKLKSVATVDRQ